MARGTRTVYPGKRNKRLSSRFQRNETKRCDKHDDKDGDNNPKNVN